MAGSPVAPRRFGPVVLAALLFGVPAPVPAQDDPAGLSAAPGLDPISQALFERAEGARDPARAASVYRMVLARDPDYLPAALGLGRALVRAGDAAGAEEVFRGLGTEPDAVEELARLVGPDRPAEALRLWKLLETLRYGDPTPHLFQARLLLATDLDAALAAWGTYQALLQGAEPDGEALAALAAALVDAGRGADAEELWRAYLDRFPAGAVAEEGRERLERLEVEKAATGLALGGAEPLTPDQDAARRAVLTALAAGRVADAGARARALVAAAPRSDAAHGAYADVLIAGKEWTEAEVQAVLARSLAPDSADHRIRLGEILATAYGGRRDAEALVEFREALALRPDEPTILFRLAAIEEATGHYEDAARHFDAVVAAGGEHAAEARERAEHLRRVAPRVDDPPGRAPLALPPEAARHYRIALVYLGRGARAEAANELDSALTLAPDAPLLLNLLARLQREDGDLAAATAALERSLAADPGQAAARFALGEIALAEGDPAAAERRFREAAAAGEADAWFLLARLAAGRGEWAQARSLVARYQESATRTSLYRESAAVLREEADRRWWAVRLGIAAGLLLLGAVPGVWWLRRRSTRTLQELLDGAPECWHDAARPLAALRHEVLKHNTTVLPDVAAALERGDDASWAAWRARAPEVLARFDQYVGELESLGARHGYRLALRTTDPVVSPMRRALARLARAEAPAPAAVRAASHAVNERGYAEIGRLLHTICILPVTLDLVAAGYDRVAAEPGFAGGGLPELELEDDGGIHQVRMFRQDLDDILANLLRNALAAGARRVRVALAERDDPITGQGWVELRVGDDAPGTLTNAMIRGRYIGRGLGLAVDLLNRHGGTIRVEVPPGAAPDDTWKEVVVDLVAVEAAPVEVEWTA